MPWPLSQDYNEALQNPQTSFSDSELRQGQVVVNALGIPQPCSGNFADVYAVECPASKTKWAVKCFTREVHGLRERYSEISSYLQQVRLPFTVDFRYLEHGIRIAGRWHPILKMHWVEGFTLNTYVRDKLDKPAKLNKLGRVWVRMARRLREAGIAHGDLQHGNVLLVPDTEAAALAVKLIDYDGMWVPALAYMPSGEFGHPAYQHPRRALDNAYSAEVDRFSLLAVYVALRALEFGGRRLWERYDTGDNLLFRQADFEAPAKSPLFAELLRMKDPEVRDLAAKLIDAARMSLEQTPHLADLIAQEKPSRSALRRRRSSAAAASPKGAAVPEESDSSEDLDPQETTPAIHNSLFAWMAAGGVAAFAVIGGVLLWRMQAGGTEKTPTQPALVQSLNQATETAANDQETQPSEDANPGDTPAIVDVPKKGLPTAVATKEPRVPSRLPINSKLEDGVAKAPDLPASAPRSPPASGKLPVPEEAVLRSTTEEIQDIYKADYASKDATVQAALAGKLLQRGLKKFEAPERRFVYLREASDVAAKAGDMVLSFRALEELAKLFAVEELPMKAATLQQAAKAARTFGASKGIVDTALSLIVVAVRADDYETAERSVKAATEAAVRAGIPYTEIQVQAKEIGRFKKQFLAIKPALATLAAQTNDAGVNRLVGTFLCFQKGEWQKGLPLLARGDDAKLKELAEKDLAAPTTADAQAALGTGWWQLGIQEKDQAKANLLQRASYWYERALPDVVAMARTKLLKNIEAHYMALPALQNWNHLDVSQATVMLDFLRLYKGEREILTREAYSGPIEITVIARTDKNNIRLRGGRGSCVIFNWERKAEELRITRPDGQQPESGSLATASVTPLEPNTWYALRWILTEDGMAVAVNGQIVFSENRKNDLSGRYSIRIHSVDSDIDVKCFHVRPLDKKSR
jgi:serine/threonine protein kinase